MYIYRHIYIYIYIHRHIHIKCRICLNTVIYARKSTNGSGHGSPVECDFRAYEALAFGGFPNSEILLRHLPLFKWKDGNIRYISNAWKWTFQSRITILVRQTGHLGHFHVLGFHFGAFVCAVTAWKLNCNGWKWFLHLKTRAFCHDFPIENHGLGHLKSHAVLIANLELWWYSMGHLKPLSWKREISKCLSSHPMVKLKTSNLRNEKCFWISLHFHICVLHCALHVSHEHGLFYLPFTLQKNHHGTLVYTKVMENQHVLTWLFPK